MITSVLWTCFLILWKLQAPRTHQSHRLVEGFAQHKCSGVAVVIVIIGVYTKVRSKLIKSMYGLGIHVFLSTGRFTMIFDVFNFFLSSLSYWEEG